MILTCPNCGTRFALDAARLGVHGRTVRCARCFHTWFAEPPAGEPPVRAATADAPSPRFTLPPETDAADHVAEPPLRPGDRPLGRPGSARRGDGETRNLPALRSEGRLGTILGWGGLVLFVAAIMGGVVLFARDITTAWPAARKLYNSLGLDPNRSVLAAAPGASAPAPVESLPIEQRLKFTNLAPSQRFIDGVLTLVISGTIESISPRDETLPPIEVVLLDNRKLDLKTWVFEPPQPSLKPGATVPFETRLENPPPEAQDIRVTFSTASHPARPQAPADAAKSAPAKPDRKG